VLAQASFLLIALNDRRNLRDRLERHESYLSKIGVTGRFEQDIEDDRCTSLEQYLVSADDPLEVDLERSRVGNGVCPELLGFKLEGSTKQGSLVSVPTEQGHLADAGQGRDFSCAAALVAVLAPHCEHAVQNTNLVDGGGHLSTLAFQPLDLLIVFANNEGMNTDHTDILIIGAGPTGLAAALFLSERGYRPRIIEKTLERSPYSKAFGVNARTLDLLSDSGVTERFLTHGRPLQRLTLRRAGQPLTTLRLDHVQHRYPFMLVQSQADSERLLEDALRERGVRVERGLEVVGLRRASGHAVVDIAAGNERDTITAKCVLAADGPGSTVRKSLGISFDGEVYDEPWTVYDVELELPLPPDEASILLLDDGGIFVVRLKGNVWRVLGNVEQLLDRLPTGTNVGKIHWESAFGISNRVAGRFAEAPLYLAGDAAHIHSGIGARGMNLGIEDAYVFATLYHQGQLERYEGLRRPTIQKVVGQIKRAMLVPRSTTVPGRIVRAVPWIISIIEPMIRSSAQRWVLGLDHGIEL
jgi:2-polyprenyl-6-methoxyphenol hydroxylase-like FAD-dependent oxidoreductase